MVTGLHVSDTLADRLDDASTLVSEDDGESSLRVLAGESVRILISSALISHMMLWCCLTCVAYASVVHLDTDLVGLGRSDFDILDRKWLSSLPGNGGLAGNCLAWSQRCRAVMRYDGRDEGSWRGSSSMSSGKGTTFLPCQR